MNIFISINLTQRLGVWIDIDLSRWIIETHNYVTFGEGRCMAVHLGPIGLGCNFPDAKGEKKQLDEFNRAMERQDEWSRKGYDIQYTDVLLSKMNGGSNE